jgi:cholesterol transport system auxiliary component
VLVRVQASLVRDRDRQLVSAEVFEASVRAQDNRVGAIVQAYDSALEQVLEKAVAWTNTTAT